MHDPLLVARFCKADAAAGLVGRAHELADGLEDRAKLLVIFAFEFIQAAGQVAVGGEDFAQLDRTGLGGAHDGDVDLNGAGAAENAGEYGDALLGEGVGAVTATAATLV